jgi:signal transduction histidine kinase
MIISDGHRTSEVLDGIRTLFRMTDQGRQPIDLNEMILGVLKSFREELRDHLVATRPELAELPLVVGHRNQLQQVVSNLVRNALEAMGTMTGRVLRVRTGLGNQDTVVVSVEDTGPGIDPKQLDNIFGAFSTTKTHGMGLGLAICRMIIERHGGQLTASSDGRSGALFQFVLPIAAADVSAASVQ